MIVDSRIIHITFIMRGLLEFIIQYLMEYQEKIIAKRKSTIKIEYGGKKKE